MRSLKLTVNPSSLGQSFCVVIEGPSGELARGELQGDMVRERIDDMLNPWIVRIANELDNELKRLRRGEKK